MKRMALLVMLMGGCPGPLEPGETRCTSMPIGNGYSTTRCKTGQAQPPVAQPVQAQPAYAPSTPGFWCATTATFGACYPVLGGCEKFRMSLTENCGGNGSDAPCPARSGCFQQQFAVCAPSGCFVDPSSCAWAEKQLGRDGAACQARR